MTVFDKFMNYALGLMLIVMFFFLMAWGTLALTRGGPTGTYHLEAEDTGYISSVYQDRAYDRDTLIYRGPNGQAWEVYRYVTGGTPTRDPGKTTLAPL